MTLFHSSCISFLCPHKLFGIAAFPLSEDHKPNRTDERQRIESAGGVVVWAGTWRVGGVLAVSRAFGESVPAASSCTRQPTSARQNLTCNILNTKLAMSDV